MLAQDNSKEERPNSTWQTPKNSAMFLPWEICEGVSLFREQIHIVHDKEKKLLGIQFDLKNNTRKESAEILGTLPGIFPEWLGDRTFQETHKTRFPYICGEMANGIASARMVLAAAKSGFLAFFGAAGLSFERVASEIANIKKTIGNSYSWGVNLIHSPTEIHLENQLVDLFLQNNVTRISASAFMSLSPAIVRYACTGLFEKDGIIQRKNFVFAKISRPEVARHFMSPAPQKILDELVHSGQLTSSEAQLARFIPLCEDITVEADSGGHTDNQVLPAIFPTILEMRNKFHREYRYTTPIRIGAAGGIGSPNGAASVFAMGAAYILTGSINQSCIESDLAPLAKKMLEAVNFGDTMMCPASDMFELGVKLQVLKRGSMYGVRANWLYELYKNYPSIDTLPQTAIERLEKEIFRLPLQKVWEETKQFWLKRDPKHIEKAERDPKHLMALLFRYYLGLSSKWAIQGIAARQFDYQIWCGPAQAAFNNWVQDSFLSKVENRDVVQVALNILEGAAQILRASQLRTYGVPVPLEAFEYKPRKLTVEPFQGIEEELSYVH